jgi:hypothetical protein
MLKKTDLSKLMPHLVAVIAFLILSYAYFSPLLEGKRLQQHDLTTFKGSAQEIIEHREATGEEALWTNSMFGGMPAYLISTKYKGNLLQHLNRLLQPGPRPGSYLFLILLGGYFLFLSLKVNPWLSLIGAVAFAFSTYNFIIISAGHNAKVVAIAYVAPLLAGIFLTYRGKRLLGAALTGIFLSLQILAGHPQITYYTLLIILFFGLSELYFSLKEKRFRELATSTGLLIAVVVVAVMSNFSRLVTTMEYDNYSMRTASELTAAEREEDKTSGLTLSYATGWSYGVDETMTLLIPGFKGGASAYELSTKSNTYQALAGLDRNFAKDFIKQTNLYWGTQGSTSGPVYLGAIVIFLFILGFFVLNGRYKWWILGVALLGIMLSWGKNFMPLTEFFMNHVPGYNKFRTVSMTLVIPQVVVPILAILTLHKVIVQGVEKKVLLYGMKWSAGIAGGLALLFLLFPSLAGNFSSLNDVRTINAISGNNEQVRNMLMDTLIPALEADREALLRTDAFRSLLFVLLGAGLIYLYSIRKVKMSLQLVTALFGLLFLADMWPVNKRFLDDNNFTNKSKVDRPFTATPAHQAIMQASGPGERVLNLTTSTFNDAETSYFHHSIGGYHGAKMRRYQDLINTRLSEEMNVLIGSLQQQDLDLVDSTLSGLNVLNMLNTKFVIINPNGMPLTNNSAMGNGWFVEELVFAENADEELEQLISADITATAVTDVKFKDKVSSTRFEAGLMDRIELTDYQPNRLTYQSTSDSERLAVFSEIFYEKGWQASIDGAPADHIRVNYLLRGMVIPEGSHTIVFEFRPKTYYTGEKVAYAGSILLLLFLAGAVYVEVKRKPEDQ